MTETRLSTLRTILVLAAVPIVGMLPKAQAQSRGLAAQVPSQAIQLRGTAQPQTFLVNPDVGQRQPTLVQNLHQPTQQPSTARSTAEVTPTTSAVTPETIEMFRTMMQEANARNVEEFKKLAIEYAQRIKESLLMSLLQAARSQKLNIRELPLSITEDPALGLAFNSSLKLVVLPTGQGYRLKYVPVGDDTLEITTALVAQLQLQNRQAPRILCCMPMTLLRKACEIRYDTEIPSLQRCRGIYCALGQGFSISFAQNALQTAFSSSIQNGEPHCSLHGTLSWPGFQEWYDKSTAQDRLDQATLDLFDKFKRENSGLPLSRDGLLSLVKDMRTDRSDEILALLLDNFCGLETTTSSSASTHAPNA